PSPSGCAEARRSCDSHSGHSGGPMRRCPRSVAARRPGREEYAAAWSDAAQARGIPGAPTRASAEPSEHGRCRHGDARGSEVSPRSLRQDQLVQRQIGHRLAKPFVLLLEILQLPKLVTAHAAILLTPPVERQLGNADLANSIRHRHALASQNLCLPKLRDDLVGLVSLVCHCGPPSWSKRYFKVDPFNGGGSARPLRARTRYTRFHFCGTNSGSRPFYVHLLPNMTVPCHLD